MMRADEGFHPDQAGWQVGEFPPMACDDCADSSVCRVKLDPNALIKKRYVGILTVKHIQSAGVPTVISPFVTSNIVLKSGVPSRSTVNRTFIAVLRSCQGSPDNPDFMITALD
jgi:hypothetical protein